MHEGFDEVSRVTFRSPDFPTGIGDEVLRPGDTPSVRRPRRHAERWASRTGPDDVPGAPAVRRPAVAQVGVEPRRRASARRSEARRSRAGSGEWSTNRIISATAWCPASSAIWRCICWATSR